MKKISKSQPENFEFTKENLVLSNNVLAKYPKNKKMSALMPLLHLAQKQHNNWIPLSTMKYLAGFLSIPYIKVYEVATFYSMYNLTPVGKYFVQVCTTTPCMIRGANKVAEICKKYISKNQNEVSKNQLCSWTEVECLGACVNGPMFQINEDYFEDLDEKSSEQIIKIILEDKIPNPGSYKNRKSSAPTEGRKTLIGEKNA